MNAKDNFEKSSLYYATEKGDLEVAKLLLKHGADSNARERNYLRSPLFLCRIQDSFFPPR